MMSLKPRHSSSPTFKTQDLCLQSTAQPAAAISGNSALVPLLFSSKYAESRQASHPAFLAPPGTGSAPTFIFSLPPSSFPHHGLTYTFFFFFFPLVTNSTLALGEWHSLQPSRVHGPVFPTRFLQSGLRALRNFTVKADQDRRLSWLLF